MYIIIFFKIHDSNYQNHSYGRLLLREYVCDTDGLTATSLTPLCGNAIWCGNKWLVFLWLELSSNFLLLFSVANVVNYAECFCFLFCFLDYGNQTTVQRDRSSSLIVQGFLTQFMDKAGSE